MNHTTHRHIVVVGTLAALGFAGRAPAQSDLLVVTEATRLTQDYAGQILVAADGIDLNCAGFEVREPNPVDQQEQGTPGQGRAGIVLVGVSGVTVRNCVIRDFWNGIRVFSGADNVLTGNRIVETLQPEIGWTVRNAILLDAGTTGNVVFGNVEEAVNGDGVALVNTSGNSLFLNLMGGLGDAYGLVSANDNALVGNIAVGGGIGGDGFHLSDSDANQIVVNTVLQERDGVRVQLDSDGNTIRGNLLLGNEHGILICGDLLSANTIARNRFIANGTNVETSETTADPLKCGVPGP